MARQSLTAQLEQAHVSYQALEQKYESLLASTKVAVPAPVPASVVGGFRAAMALAKAEAVRTGKSVKVIR